MPKYDFQCEDCQRIEELNVQWEEIPEFIPICCGKSMRRKWGTFTHLVHPWQKPEAEKANAIQKAYLERPDIQAKLKSGELQIQKG